MSNAVSFFGRDVVAQATINESQLFALGASDDLISSLNDTKGQKPTSVQEMRQDVRKYIANTFSGRRFYGNNEDKIRACFALSSTNRAAIFDLRSYFNKKIRYSNTLEYEIGYLTQLIIYRYQMMLEIFQLIEARYVGKEDKNFAPNTYVFYMYTNLLDHATAIVHYCNMMHELERKYLMRKKKGVFDEEEKPVTQQYNNSDLIKAKKELEDEAKKLRKEKNRIRKEQLNRLRDWNKFAPYSRTQKTTPKRGPFPLIYGW